MNQYITDGGANRDDSEQVSQVTYEIGETELPSEAVIRAVAAFTNTSVIGLDPLYEVIDPTNLDEMMRETGSPVRAELSFLFHGCEVTVTPDEVRVCEAEDED